MVMKKTVLKIILAAGVFLSIMTANAYAAAEIDRLAGDDRYGTAVEISKKGWVKGSSEYAIIATGDGFSDALYAAPLAKKLNAPILLNGPTVLDDRVSEELTRLGAKKVYIIGGQSLIPEAVLSAIAEKGIKCERIAGADRYETPIEIAKYLEEFDSIVIASNKDFPDVLSIAPIAAKKGMPIFLSDKDSLPQSVENYLKDKKISKAYIVGGTDAISNGVMDQLKDYNPERLSGKDRYETNIAVLNRFSDELNFLICYVATGRDFPDALAGSAAAAITSSPIILVDKTATDAAKKFVALRLQAISRIKILGGEGAVSIPTADELLGINTGDRYNDYTLRYDADFKVNVYKNINWVPSNILGKPKLTREQVSKLVKDPEILKKSISTVYDAIQYIRSSNFKGTDDIVFIEENGYKWQHYKKGEKAIVTNEGGYASIANMVNYLLKDDYEETGFIHYFQEDGAGYALNYFKHNGKYYIVDFTRYRNDFRYTAIESGDTKDYYKSDYIMGNIHEAESLEDYIAYCSKEFTDPAELYTTYVSDSVLPVAVKKVDGYTYICYPADKKETIKVLYDVEKDRIKIEYGNWPTQYPSWT